MPHAVCLVYAYPIRMYHVAFMELVYVRVGIQTGLVKYADRFMTYTTICYSYVFASHPCINDIIIRIPHANVQLDLT